MLLSITNVRTGKQFDLGEAALPVGFLRENGRYRISFEAAGTRSVSLLIADQRISPSLTATTPENTRVEWEWSIEEFAGESILTLLEGTTACAEATVDIAPHPRKLGAETYRELLLDLQDKAEGVLFGTTPAHAQLRHAEAQVPLLARFALFRTYLPQLERAFRAIEEAPHRSLIPRREECTLHKVRRVDRHTLRTALKRMPVLAALSNKQTTGEPATLNVPRREHTYDTSPNRHIAGLLIRLIAHCSELHKRLQTAAANKQEPPESQQRATRWAHLAEGFQKRLARLRGADFLSGVEPNRTDTAALMTISRHPAYSQFDRVARRVLFPRVALGGDPDKRLCLRHTYDIYEYWCFFAVAEAVRRAFPDADWTSDVSLSHGLLLLNIRNGSSVIGTLGDSQVSVTFQKAYGGKSDKNGLFSISKRCIPDIVVTLTRPDSFRTVIFDAKYRSSGASIHDALSDIHAYRDAIRTDAASSAIHAAFILTPAHDSGQERYYTDAYRQEFAFGGFDLLPRQPQQEDALVKAIQSLFT